MLIPELLFRQHLGQGVSQHLRSRPWPDQTGPDLEKREGEVELNVKRLVIYLPWTFGAYVEWFWHTRVHSCSEGSAAMPPQTRTTRRDRGDTAMNEVLQPSRTFA